MSSIGYQSRNIEMLLTTNSDLHLKKVYKATPVLITAKTEYRPDRIFGADGYMKISLITAGIDSPWMLVRGNAVTRPDRNSLNHEFVDMDGDFHI